MYIVLKTLKGNYIFLLLISSSLLISLLKSDSKLGLNRSLKETLKSIVILFSSSSLIIIPLITSYIIYKKNYYCLRLRLYL
jgi:hypothetical protein